jgi:Tol biopolymer transport system component
VERDTNAYHDIFVHDRWSGNTERVTLSSEGAEADWDSYVPHGRAISDNGRYVTFVSLANNLAMSDTNTVEDVFVYDRITQQTTLVSTTPSGTSGNGVSSYSTISGNGRYVAFASGANNLVASDTTNPVGVFVRDLEAGETWLVSVTSDGTPDAGGGSQPTISSDGRYIAFVSSSTTLVTGDTNNENDVFLHDIVTRQTTRISVANDGTQGDAFSTQPAISGDGRYVAFLTKATNLVSDNSGNVCPAQNHLKLMMHDRESGQTTCISSVPDDPQHSGRLGGQSLSNDGRYVAFYRSASSPVQHYRDWQVFVHDREIGETSLISVAEDGTAPIWGASWGSGPSISADGRYVAFESFSDNLIHGDTNEEHDIFVRDRGFTATHWLYLPIANRHSPD